jgi:CPA2 family monovalent cation:H+ antiporter-2
MTGHTIVAGYGLPGRAVVDLLHAHGVPHCVIELNPETVQRCAKVGTPIIEGDCTDPQVLRAAGIEHASTFIIAIPHEKMAVEATRQARLLNQSVRIVTRCHYLSTGIEAKAHGANDIIVSEQVVATELSRRIASELESKHST